MASVDESPKTGWDRFQTVLRSPTGIKGEAQRDPPGVLVYPSGVGPVNVAGTELLDSLAVASGADIKQYAVILGGDEAARQVGAKVVTTNTAGAAAVRRSAAKNTVTLYLSEVFRDMPSLRPKRARWCPLTVEPEDGQSFAVISLGTALDRKRKRRSSAAPQAQKA